MHAPLVLTREQSRRVDALATSQYGIPSIVLMENAGRGVVEVLLELDPTLSIASVPAPSPRRGGLGRGEPLAQPSTTVPPTPLHEVEASGSHIAILCGKGNNAGDGFVIARHLAIRGAAASVLLLTPPEALVGDARTNFDILVRTGGSIVDLSSMASSSLELLADGLDHHAGNAAWLVDAMLGTGAQGVPREPFRSAIAWMNAQPGRRLAVDVPSGLDCDSGRAAGEAVRADVTCTFVAAKPGLLVAEAAPWVGDLRVVGIGLAPHLAAQFAKAE